MSSRRTASIVIVEAPALTAINMRLRDDYTRDAAGGVGRWNKIIEKAGIKFELKLPHEGFNRKIGVFAGKLITPEGNVLSNKEWDDKARRVAAQHGRWRFHPVADEARAGARQISRAGSRPPKVGIDNKPGDFEYVKLHMA